jgi:hypothetical protein
MFRHLSTTRRPPPLLLYHLHRFVHGLPDGILNVKGTYGIDSMQFSRIIIDRPHVANYVRLVRIILGTTLSIKFAVLSSILANLSQITSIALGTTRSYPWGLLDLDFCMAFQNSIRLPSIKQVAIHNIQGFPLDSFDHCKNLNHLLLLGQCTRGADTPTTSYPRLRYLGLESQNEVTITRVVSWMKSNTLRDLWLRLERRLDLPQSRPLLEACSATLVNLKLSHTFGGELCFYFYFYLDKKFDGDLSS